MIKKFKFINIFLLLIFISKTAYSLEPNIFVQSTVNRASQILSSDISKSDKIEKLKIIATDTVDIKGIGFYTLGKFRKELNDAEKKEYTKLFREYFLKSFSSRLAEYTNPKIDVQSQEKLNDKYTIVSSVLVATDTRPEIKIQWRVYTKDPDRPLIRDLIIEGLSLARTQKEEFSSIIQSSDGDIQSLFSSLKKFINN
ncbi:MlaC/ttg2D family ABC transporter substrate-binding protein [Candidatus Pelagibacter communis]|uniref:MlaC/ttg2D family ABC transporter substrate-binding protein n=1 Tax=Pelagibacter ubique TaxID=198252 RepID=UPI00094DA558|nr:ABC transporter substrate-binding protein [Candidatus Pelagibacter ubique]